MKTKKKLTRLWSVLLTLALLVGLLPTVALAEGPVTETADFAADPTAALALLNTAKTGAADSTWDPTSSTLTLNGVNFVTTAATAVKLPADTTIVLADGTTNTITSTYSGPANSYGIYVDNGNLTIQGETAGTGKLIVNGGTATGEDKDSYGIRANQGDVTISGGTVEVTGGAATHKSSGIYARRDEDGSGGYIGGNINISGGAEVTAAGGDVTDETSLSYGLFANEAMTISGGAKVTATGGASSDESYGIRAYRGDVTITGGTVTATGGAANEVSSGIEAYEGNVTINSGTVIAKAAGSATTAVALNRAPGSLPAAYSWRIAESGGYSEFPDTAYEWSSSHSYVEIKDPTPGSVTCTVTDLTIEDAICPINGETPVTAIAATEEYTGTIAWEGSPASFEPGEEYTATITLTAKEGYTFDGLSANAFIIPGAKSVTNDANSGTITAVFKSPPEGYITDGRGFAAYQIKYNEYKEVDYFDIINTYHGVWMGTTYSYLGYGTIYRYGVDDPVDVSVVGQPVDMGKGITLTVQPYFSIDGKFINVAYTLKNTGSADATVSVGSHADIMIGDDDKAPITKFEDGRGFMMVNQTDPNLQFNFFGKKTLGATDVDTFWFGEYSDRWDNVFTQVEVDSLSDTDSGMAYAWVDRVIPAGGTRVFRTIMGTSDAASDTNVPIGVNFDTQGGSEVESIVVSSAGSTISEPAAPVRSGYQFAGWYTEPEYVNRFDFSTPILETITLYAKWISNAPFGFGDYTPPTYKVESQVTEDTDGSVSFSKNSAKKGDTVTITVTPDRYYKTSGVIVKDASGRMIAVTDNGNGTFTFQMPDSKVTVEPVFSWDNPFVDVAGDAYYAPAVEWALKNDITNGTSATTFSPNAGCTRGQIVTFLWRAAGCPEPAGRSSFTDVSADAYYAKAVAWAAEQGITGGTGDGKFSPDATCTRGQIVTFLWRAEKSPAVGTANPFTDVEADAYYAGATNWAVENGITEGTGDGTTFSPANDCTRAQIVTFLYRYFVK